MESDPNNRVGQWCVDGDCNAKLSHPFVFGIDFSTSIDKQLSHVEFTFSAPRAISHHTMEWGVPLPNKHTRSGAQVEDDSSRSAMREVIPLDIPQ